LLGGRISLDPKNIHNPQVASPSYLPIGSSYPPTSPLYRASRPAASDDVSLRVIDPWPIRYTRTPRRYIISATSSSSDDDLSFTRLRGKPSTSKEDKAPVGSLKSTLFISAHSQGKQSGSGLGKYTYESTASSSSQSSSPSSFPSVESQPLPKRLEGIHPSITYTRANSASRTTSSVQSAASSEDSGAMSNRNRPRGSGRHTIQDTEALNLHAEIKQKEAQIMEMFRESNEVGVRQMLLEETMKAAETGGSSELSHTSKL